MKLQDHWMIKVAKDGGFSLHVFFSCLVTAALKQPFAGAKLFRLAILTSVNRTEPSPNCTRM